MIEDDTILCKKIIEYIDLKKFDEAEDLLHNYSSRNIDTLFGKYTYQLYKDCEFYRFFINDFKYYHTCEGVMSNNKTEICPPYKDYYSKNLKIFNNKDVDKRLLICGALPIGDQIYFMRYLPYVMELTSNITVITLDRLIEHFSKSFPEINFVEDDKNINLKDFDCVMFMPHMGRFAFDKGNEPVKEFIPTAVSNKNKVELLKSNPSFIGKNIVGFSWRSTRGDVVKNDEIGELKSIPLSALKKVFNLPNTIFINLQHGNVDEELRSFISTHNIDNIYTPNELDMTSSVEHIIDYVDMCDFIVTTSNTLVMMAGALHKDTYLILPPKQSKGRLWFWHNFLPTGGREHIAFPTVKMYEQEENFTWDGCINLIYDNLFPKLK